MSENALPPDPRPETHTPGPWNLLEGKTLLHIEQDGTGEAICSVPRSKLANARLIAAAPDMLAALRRAALALAFAAENSAAMRDDYKAVSDAIAKATGATT